MSTVCGFCYGSDHELVCVPTCLQTYNAVSLLVLHSLVLQRIISLYLSNKEASNYLREQLALSPTKPSVGPNWLPLCAERSVHQQGAAGTVPRFQKFTNKVLPVLYLELISSLFTNKVLPLPRLWMLISFTKFKCNKVLLIQWRECCVFCVDVYKFIHLGKVDEQSATDALLVLKTSQELRMLSRSLSVY